MSTRKDTGVTGEHMAEKFLLSRKFKILEKNFISPFGEIDLIARDKNFLVFVEVKTRISETFGHPLESIDIHKQRHIVNNCRYYMARRSLREKYWRIDVIGIKLNRSLELEILRHIKNAIVKY